jgi:uncharacterized membrane protein
MRRAYRSKGLLMGVAFLATLSCQRNAGSEAQIFEGLATFGHEVRSFRPCGAEKSFWAIDSTGVLWELHGELAPGAEPYEEVFARVRGHLGPPPTEGFGASYEGTLVVKEVLYAAGEGFGCDTDWSRFSYRASGNEPFWTLHITPQELSLNQLGLEERIWPLTSEKHARDAAHFSGQAPDGSIIEVVFSQDPCRDSMSGAYYSLSVAIQIEGGKLFGCGMEGAYPG